MDVDSQQPFEVPREWIGGMRSSEIADGGGVHWRRWDVKPTDIVVKKTGRAGCWPTVDIQTSFHSFLLLLVHLKLESKWTQGREVALIQSTNCADWHSKHLRVRISDCPPPGIEKSTTRGVADLFLNLDTVRDGICVSASRIKRARNTYICNSKKNRLCL